MPLDTRYTLSDLATKTGLEPAKLVAAAGISDEQWRSFASGATTLPFDVRQRLADLAGISPDQVAIADGVIVEADSS